VVLQNANWRCQIAREDRYIGRATVYDHRIGVKMLDLTPPAIRPTCAELDEHAAINWIELHRQWRRASQ
jgi:hypothetical protein